MKIKNYFLTIVGIVYIPFLIVLFTSWNIPSSLATLNNARGLHRGRSSVYNNYIFAVA